jgi:hypothetical protein
MRLCEYRSMRPIRAYPTYIERRVLCRRSVFPDVVALASISSSESANSSQRSVSTRSGFHFGRIQSRSLLAVSTHSPGLLQSSTVRSCWHGGHPQFLRPIPDGFTICGRLQDVVFRLAMLEISCTVRTWCFSRRHLRAGLRRMSMRSMYVHHNDHQVRHIRWYVVRNHI